MNRITITNESQQHYQLLSDAITNVTPYSLKKDKDEYGETIYWLLDGCGDPDGDHFESLVDVEDYISNHDEVQDYILWKRGVIDIPGWME